MYQSVYVINFMKLLCTRKPTRNRNPLTQNSESSLEKFSWRWPGEQSPGVVSWNRDCRYVPIFEMTKFNLLNLNFELFLRARLSMQMCHQVGRKMCCQMYRTPNVPIWYYQMYLKWGTTRYIWPILWAVKPIARSDNPPAYRWRAFCRTQVGLKLVCHHHWAGGSLN